MVKYTQTIHRQQSTNCLSGFDHFVGLAFKGLIFWEWNFFFWQIKIIYYTLSKGLIWQKQFFSEKTFKGLLSAMIQFLATESISKLTKNAFYFNLKALFVLKIWCRLPGNKLISIHMLPHIVRSKDTQETKLNLDI